MATPPMSRVVDHLRRVAFLQEGQRLTDEKLLESFLVRREDAAFEALVRRHGPMILGVCRRILQDRHDAEDAFQATFLIFLRKTTAIGKRESLASWLYGVAHRTALQARKCAAKRRAKERQVADMSRKQITGDDAIQDMLPLLDQELSRLPDKYRAPIILCDLEGKTTKKAALDLDVPERTLATRLTRARAMLAKRLARHGTAISGTAVALAVSQSMASASVPPSLVAATVKIGALVMVGKTGVAGVISAKVFALTEGVVKTMLLTKLKTMVAVTVVVLGVGAFGGGLVAHRSAWTFAADEVKQDTTQAKGANGANDLAAQEPKLRATLQGHTNRVTSVAYSPDGKTLASASWDGTIKLWDVAAGKEKATFKGHRREVCSVAYSPDGKTLASGSGEHAIKLWDLATGKEKATLWGHDCGVWGMAYSPDGKTLASEDTGDTTKLWDVATGWEKATFNGDSRRIFPVALAFNADSKTLASASFDGSIKLLDVVTGEQKATFKGHREGVSSVAYSPDGKTLVSASWDGTIILWDVATGKESATFRGHRGEVSSVAYSPDGKTLASGGWDCTIMLWEVATGKEKTTLLGHAGYVWSVAFSPDGRTLASASEDKTIKLWDMPDAQEIKRENKIGILQDGKAELISGATLPLKRPNVPRADDVPSNNVKADRLLIWKEGGLASIRPDGDDLKWVTEMDVKKGVTYYPFPRLSPNGQHVAYRINKKDKVGNETFKYLVKGLDEPGPGRELDVAGRGGVFGWSPDGNKLLVAIVDSEKPERYSNWLFDLRTMQKTSLKMPEGHLIRDWSPDGKWFLTTYTAAKKNGDITSRRLHLVKIDGSESTEIGDPNQDVLLGYFSPDGMKILFDVRREVTLPDEISGQIHVERHGQLHVLNLRTGKARPVTLEMDRDFVGFCWSADGKKIAYCSQVEGRRLVTLDVDGYDAKTIMTGHNLVLLDWR